MRAVLITIPLLLVPTDGSTHEWYLPWCCDFRDCAPIDAEEIEPTPRGWRIKPTGEVMPYTDNGVLQSKDSQFHRCERTNGTTRCLYVPDAGS